MLLSTLVDTWYLRERELSKKSAEQLNRSVAIFSEHLGRVATTDDLRDDIVSGWLISMTDRFARRTIYGHRGNLLTIWRFAAGMELAPMPARVRKVSKPKPNPIAWTPAEWQRLIVAADAIEGTIRNTDILMADYFGCLMRAAYDTGLRRGDLFALRQDDIREDGRLRIIQRKTSDPHQPAMRPATLARFRALPGRLPLKWPGNISCIYYWFTKLRRTAGLHAGCLHQTRRTGATLVVRQTNSIESARQYLGHRSGDMWRHYVDFGIADPNPILPPDFDKAG